MVGRLHFTHYLRKIILKTFTWIIHLVKRSIVTGTKSCCFSVVLKKKPDSYMVCKKSEVFAISILDREAVSAGCMTAIREDDNMITAYRDHGLALAKGMSARECMAELYGKATGCTKGKGGSMHFFSKEKKFFGGHGIVGGQIGLGAGIAFAEKYKGSDAVTLCFFWRWSGASRIVA
jgi:TPP-dependent pyruvate/acetoin dehydrogenase alpha subunit